MSEYIKMDEDYLLALRKKITDLHQDIHKWRARCAYWEQMYLDLAQHTTHKNLVDQIMDFPKASPDEAE